MNKSHHKFRLYIAGDAQNSAQAVANLATLCREHFPGRHEIELIDVLRHPKRALEESIFMTPTLVRYAPGPLRKVVGTLSNTDIVLSALGLQAAIA
jgi:circadian clock protein KaiB